MSANKINGFEVQPERVIHKKIHRETSR